MAAVESLVAGCHRRHYSNKVREHAVPELWFKPGALGRHDSAFVGDAHQIFDAGRVHGKSDRVFSAVNHLDQFSNATNASHEADPIAFTWIINGQQGRQDVILQQ